MTATVALGTRHALRVVERNGRSYVRQWQAFVSGFFEPVLYLLSIGIGVGELVGEVRAPGGQLVAYDQFVAPAMMALAAMNGCVLDTTIGFFFKAKYAKVYDGMLATPLGVADVVRGELTWALTHSVVNATVFFATMALLGLAPSAWGLLAIPGAALIGFAFGGAGLGLTTYMRSWFDFDYVNIAIFPLFLFSATFFPIDQYPDVVAWIVRVSPLYQGVALERALVLGDPSPVLLLHVAYLVAMGWFGVRVAGRRLGLSLQP